MDVQEPLEQFEAEPQEPVTSQITEESQTPAVDSSAAGRDCSGNGSRPIGRGRSGDGITDD